MKKTKRLFMCPTDIPGPDVPPIEGDVEQEEETTENASSSDAVD